MPMRTASGSAANVSAGNGGNDIERRPHGSLGIVFVRDGIPGIGQYPVAPEIGQAAIIASRNAGAGGVIGVDYEADVLWIELGR